MKKKVVFTCVAALMCMLAVGPLFAAGSSEEAGDQEGFSVLVYITGVIAGSPPYQALAEGAEEFAAEHENVSVKVYEAGFNQAEWEDQLTSLVATGSYDVVLGSNPSLPEICSNVGEKFPEQEFIITDAQLSGHSQIATYLYNQYEQSFYLGYLAGLVTVSDMEYANEEKKIGFLVAQEYPLLTKQIIPGFIDGAKRVDADITLDTRVVGNWNDANKAAELTASMIDSGVDVFASIAGGAAQGLFKEAQDEGAYIVYHNTDAYDNAPGYVLGCGIMEQKKLTKEILTDYMAGNIEFGTAKSVGVQNGYLGFLSDHEAYKEYVPEDIREQFNDFFADMKAGNIDYTVPEL
ncbi:MAG: BMP family ABC transporter substrate-binding protein [Spirochaetota bacterium]